MWPFSVENPLRVATEALNIHLVSCILYLMAASAYTWRVKLTTLAMETFRRMRNTTHQASLSARSSILKKFIYKVRKSGYSQSSCNGVIESGLHHYYRKLRIDLEGGPRLNLRNERDAVQKKRRKMGANHNWFSRRRGGVEEKWKKENKWRTPVRDQATRTAGQGSRQSGKHTPRNSRSSPQGQTQETRQEEKPRIISTLLVPYTVGSHLQESMQNAEDEFCRMTGGEKVLIVEKGGEKLANLMCRNDPWAARRVCTDSSYVSCSSRTWLKDQKRAAKKSGQELPGVLIKSTSNQCCREGLTYTLQCQAKILREF